MSVPRLAAPALVTAGAAVALVGTFMTWVRSGAAERSSYEVFGIVERLGFSSSGVVGLALRAWPLVPLLLVLAAVAHWYAADHVVWRAVTAALTLAAALYPGSIAVAVLNAPEIGVFATGRGPAVTITGAVIVLAGLAISVVRATGVARATRP